MISLAEARSLIALHTTTLEAVPCSLVEAQDRVLRSPVFAAEDFPAFDRSSMDGYAVAREDRSECFQVIGEVQPGDAAGVEIQAGECVRIFTGGRLPRGASQVIMQEDAQRDGNTMTPLQRGTRTNVRLRGEEARVGDLLLPVPTRLGAGELSLLAQAGSCQVKVTRRPRVLHLATGGELVAPDLPPGAGQIRDSNSTLIAALLQTDGAEIVLQARCGDDPAALRALVESKPVEAWDLLLISGGASVGDYDFGTRVLQALGFEIIFSKVNLKPGKPLVFARRGAQIAFVIPGNPVSHFVTYHVAIHAALEQLSAIPPSWPLVPARLERSLPAFPADRETYWPARLSVDGQLIVHPLQQQSSGDLCALVGANALVQTKPPCEAAPVGTSVPCLLLGRS